MDAIDRATDSDDSNSDSVVETWGRRVGSHIASSAVFRDRVPPRRRPALFLETIYNIGTGAFVSLFLLTPVVLKTILGGSADHLALFAAMFGGSSLLSPLVSYAARWLPMRSLIILPNLAVASLLFATALPFSGPLVFTLVVGGAFIVRVFPRVGEMNMYRVFYPYTHRGAAVGWVKSIAAVSALVVTLLGYWWFSFLPGRYWMLYWLVGFLLFGSTIAYSRIPVSRRDSFTPEDQTRGPHRAFWNGLRAFFADRRFVLYQIGFSLAGFANHMALVFVAEVLTDLLSRRSVESIVPAFLHPLVLTSWQWSHQTVMSLVVGFVFAVVPGLLMMSSLPFWGRFLDRVNPMLGRSVFNTFQCIAFGLHAYGGMTLQIWPFLLGAIVHSIGNGGQTINWLTGSLYFARSDQVSLYNTIHVHLTGLRGLTAPLIGLYLYRASGLDLGPRIFWVAAVLSLLGAVFMLVQGLLDPGSRERDEGSS